MQINEKAPLVTERNIFIEAPPEAVWKVHTDVETWAEWNRGIPRAEGAAPLEVGKTFRWKSGGVTIASTVLVMVVNKRIGWSGIALGSRARHLWILTPEANGTRVTTQESMEGWLPSVMKLLMPKMLEKSLDAWLQDLKRKVEH